jgi:hypothetical protein
MTIQRFIAAFDIATAVGCCDGVPGTPPRVWTWYTSDGGDSRPLKLCYLRRLLDEYFSSVHVDAVYYEQPVNLRAMMRIGATDDTIALLRGAVGVVESCAVHHGIQIVEAISVQDARQALTGKRTFPRLKGKSTAKDAIIDTARMLGVDVATDHEADAFAIWWAAGARHNPRLAHLSQPLFARVPNVTTR